MTPAPRRRRRRRVMAAPCAGRLLRLALEHPDPATRRATSTRRGCRRPARMRRARMSSGSSKVVYPRPRERPPAYNRIMGQDTGRAAGPSAIQAPCRPRTRRLWRRGGIRIRSPSWGPTSAARAERRWSRSARSSPGPSGPRSARGSPASLLARWRACTRTGSSRRRSPDARRSSGTASR